MAADAESFYLEQVTITDGSEDDYQYEEVPADDDFSLPEGDEDLEKAMKTVQQKTEDLQLHSQRSILTSKQPIPHKPEVMDDFVRNFLIKKGMTQTLECFQTEWYEMLHKGLLSSEDVEFVPDIYSHNQILDVEIKSLRKELEQYKEAASKAGHIILKLQKERDFHRMHHKRVAQEKNRLINDIKRLKTHYASYEPLLRQLHEKYEMLLRQKMLTSLERDRVVGQITGLQATLRSIESGRGFKVSDAPVTKYRREDSLLGPTQQALLEAREKNLLQEGVAPYDPSKDPTKQVGKSYPKDSEFPLDTRVNPYLVYMKKKGNLQIKLGAYQQNTTIKAHELAVSCLALHPRKEILVTGSDDHLWRMWSIIKGELIMTGDGHTDWISGCSFHPKGTKLATSSGDTTIRIWDFAKAECILTLEGHGHAVWDCSWHSCGDFLASSSMDKTSKIWDINSERCRYTLRGHVDSVNSIEFLPFSNIILTSSADKTLSIWDARTGLCAQTFYGHMHSCNDATFNLKGDTIVSCDSYGVLKLWDVRKVAVTLSFDAGPHPGNQVAFSPTGQMQLQYTNGNSGGLLKLENYCKDFVLGDGSTY
uniref:Sperm-associated antigen 16 protein isoform X2 n=1 Tax=Geotrypetes seraphini TaxID=260995 RepID=A0A6P8QWV2_GEOSA|nr:sperm-associated antigen 16 protein isoform X2 [Geotrypetes seraphini]